MAELSDVERLVNAADAVINALRTAKPAIDANPLFWMQVEKRIQAAMDEYDDARATIMGDPANQ